MGPHANRPELCAPAIIPRRAEQTNLCRAILGLERRSADLFAPGAPRGQIGETVQIGFAIMLGQLEGRPCELEDLVAQLGLARTTVSNKMQVLIDVGSVAVHHTPDGIFYCLTERWANSHETRDKLRDINSFLHVSLRAIEDASILDTVLEDPSAMDALLLASA